MGVFDKFLDIMKLNDDEYDDDDFYDDDFEDDDFDEKPHRSIFGNKKSRSDDFDDFDMDEDKHLAPSSGNKVTPMRQPAARRGVNMEVCVVKPTSVDDSREITETLPVSYTHLDVYKRQVSAQTDHGRGIRSACHGCDLTDRLQVDPEFLLADVCGKYCLTSGCYFSWDRGKWCDKMAGSWICAVSAFRSDKIDHDLVFCQIFG